jgi:hypothetical protein
MASMIDNLDILPLAGVAVFVAASAAHRRLVRAAQPLRLLLAEKGEALLVHPRLSKELRETVKFMMDRAFGNRFGLLLGIVIIPTIALCMIFRPSSVATQMRRLSNADPEVQALFTEVMRLNDRITLANHPILLLLLETEILLLFPVGILFLGLVKGRIPSSGDRDTVINLIETREARMWGRGRLAA